METGPLPNIRQTNFQIAVFDCWKPNKEKSPFTEEWEFIFITTFTKSHPIAEIGHNKLVFFFFFAGNNSRRYQTLHWKQKSFTDLQPAVHKSDRLCKRRASIEIACIKRKFNK